MRKSLGNKRNEIANDDIRSILSAYHDFAESDVSKIFKTTDFAFRQITVERPLRLNFSTDAERVARISAFDAKKFPVAEILAALEGLPE